MDFSFSSSSSSSSSPPRALLPARWSRVDVSESTWYRGWRIKSVELNSCHCSDSSRAERRGSERTSRQTSGARRGRRGRERGPDGRGGPVRERAPGKGCRSGRRNRDTGSGAASLSAPVQLELHGLGDGRGLPSSQVSESLRNSGGASATGSLFSVPFLKGGNRSFSKRAAFLFAFFFLFFCSA